MADIAALIDELDARGDSFAQAAVDAFLEAVPEARAWSTAQRAMFVDQARSRFGAILAIAEQGTEVDEALVQDLLGVGKNAANSGASLAHLLLVLRLSRDILVDNTMEYLHVLERGGSAQFPLAVVQTFLTRLVPAVDNMVDAITMGYFQSSVASASRDVAQLSALVHNTDVPMYEADIDGIIQFANDAFGRFIGLSYSEVMGQRLSDVLPVATMSPDTVQSLLAEPQGDRGRAQLVLRDGDTMTRPYSVSTGVRRDGNGQAVGFVGAMLDVASEGAPDATSKETQAASDVTDAQSTRVDARAVAALVEPVLALQKATDALREAGNFLGERASAITPTNVTAVATAIKRQADRMRGLVDDIEQRVQDLSS